ncbi:MULTISPECIES: autotransporter domain-containing protein [unclassified Beijerinckia]|uniref:autotransporter outer membrane beta-barrel domain-containing protein n=1 Tax=unclassified Beijerinckia TaxID=2638183 RepID=UPI00089CD1C3|nr:MULTISPECIES: autotransporter domain-containing protein [unclassified Beijerinckia]MDH7795539.1 subtilase-type serine protease [Beijerinckia sp. GAS462]SEC05727.1 outer membrane autotransporter barrel domain-containing protein [Beijerinckia sp. 28-YEA-48]
MLAKAGRDVYWRAAETDKRAHNTMRIALLMSSALLAVVPVQAADVEITTNTPSVNLDSFSGTTAHIASGVTVGSASPALRASLQAWSVTNNGNITGGNTVQLDQGGTFLNANGATITGTLTALTFGYKPFGLPPAGGPGTLDNYGTITGGVEGVTMWLGGTVNNHFGGTIETLNGTNAVSIGQGTSRTLFNSGTIRATKTTGFSTGVLMQGGPSTFTNTSTGVIFGDYNGVYTSATTPFTSFTNAGSITSRRGPAVEATGGGTFVNSGMIGSTNTDGILIRNNANADITNSGTISGAVNAINFAAAGGVATPTIHTLRLQTGSVLNGNVLGGANTDNLILEGTGSESIAKFLNFENLTMNGGDWTVTGAGTFSSGTNVQAGTLRVAGGLTTPALMVQPGGTLSGTGTVISNVNNGGSVRVDSGTMLTINGNYLQQSSAFLVIGATPSAAGLLSISGTATLSGGVQVLAGSGTYALSTQYTILTATGGRTGTFGSVSSDLAFVAPSLSYDANNVYLTLVRNSIDFAAIGSTFNQRAAGAGVESLGWGGPIYNAILNLSAPQARFAFDQLSGEVHASAKTVIVEDSRFLRDASIDRLRSAFDGVGATPMPVMSYAPGGPVLVTGNTERFAVWGRAFGGWGTSASNGNAARMRHDAGGAFVGADGLLADTWRVGLLAGYSRSSFRVSDRSSSGASDNYHLGIYGGTQFGALAFRSGASLSWHDITTNRSVTFPGFTNSLHGRQTARTAQVFGEVGYGIRAGSFGLEPFANLAYVNLTTDGFSETGGPAALNVRGNSTGVTFTTLGLRASQQFNLGSVSLTARGTLGWRYAFGDVTPISAAAFAGGTPFSVAGLPIAKNAALVEAGLDFNLTSQATLGLSYGGQFGSRLTDQTIKGNFAWKF